jgi:hypothetical protein
MRRICSRGTVTMQRIMRLTVLVGAVSLAAGGLGRDRGRQHSAIGSALGFTLPTQSIVGLMRPVPVCARPVIFFQPADYLDSVCLRCGSLPSGQHSLQREAAAWAEKAWRETIPRPVGGGRAHLAGFFTIRRGAHEERSTAHEHRSAYRSQILCCYR